MKKIMLVCSAGMSTSLLVTKMEQAAEKVGDEVEIFALPMSDGINRLSTVDCVLLDRKSTRLNSSHITPSRMPSSA